MMHHLWQSTAFVVAIAALAFLLRKHQAHVRHWLWFSASIKFLVPFAMLSMLGASVEWTPPAPLAASPLPAAIEQITYPPVLEIRTQPETNRTTSILWILWGCGALAVLTLRLRDGRRVRAMLRASTPLDLAMPVPMRAAPGLLEPGVVGIFKPVLLLPAGIERHLSPAQLEAVLAHELAHVRRRDNLLSSTHMLVETLFWFHPLVWWIGARLIEERERACDEAVLSLGGEPRTYADGIVNVCKLYTESPLACVSGISGADLRKRIEAIMTNPTLLHLTATRKTALAIAACAVLLLPLALGLLRAQEPLKFEVASIKPTDATQTSLKGGKTMVMLLPSSVSGGPGTATPEQITYQRFALIGLIMRAYGVRADEIEREGGLGGSRVFDIVAKVPPGATADQLTSMLRDLLSERFGLRFHKERRTRDVYLVKVANGGPKFRESAPPPEPSDAAKQPQGVDDEGFPILTPDAKGISSRMVGGPMMMTGQRATMADLLPLLQNSLGRQLVDETGLTGAYDFRLKFGAGAVPLEGVSTPREALESLGLRLENGQRQVEVMVIDAIDLEPTEN